MKGLWHRVQRFPSSPRLTSLRMGLVLWLWFLPASVHSQRSGNWRVYKAADGLADSLCTTVTVSPFGRAWIRHGDAESLSWLDGYEVRRLPCLAGGAFRVYEYRTNQIWSVFGGGLGSFRRDHWMTFPVAEIQDELQTNPRFRVRPFPMAPIGPGRVLFLLPDSLCEFNFISNRTFMVLSSTNLATGRFLDMGEARDGGLWITGARGLLKLSGPLRTLKGRPIFQEFVIPQGLEIQSPLQPSEDEDGAITMVAETTTGADRVVAYFEGQSWKTFKALGGKVRQAWRGLDDSFWAVSLNALSRVDRDGQETVEREAVLAGQLFDAAIQPKGAFLLATSEGLIRYAPLPWRTPRDIEAMKGPVHASVEDAEHRLWFASATSLIQHHRGQWRIFPFPENVEVQFQPTDGLFCMPDGSLLLNASDKILSFNPATLQYSMYRRPDGRPMRILGRADALRVCCQVFAGETNKTDFEIALFDGHRYTPLMTSSAAWNIGSELYFFQARTNANAREYWFGGNNGAGVWRENKWQTFSAADGETPEVGYCGLVTENGNIWVGANGKIHEYDGKRWTVAYAGFDRVNAMIRDLDNHVWVAASDGLHRFAGHDWLVNGVEEGLPSPVVYEVILESAGNRLWAGTSRGLSVFDPQADIDPPRASIASANGQSDFFIDATITLAFSGQDKWRFTPADRLLYSYRRDNVQWSSFSSDNTISFKELTPGSHRVEARAMDRNGNVDNSNQALFVFSVSVPWYLETRLLFISFTGLVASLFFAAVAVNRHRRLKHSYAAVEKIVAQRTHELELANQALLHSQKMKALGTMAAGIAHDFSNILSIIKGSAQIIEAHLEDKDKIRTRVSRIKTVVDQGTTIVKAMLGFSRSAETKLAPASLNQIIDETLKILGDQFHPLIQFKTELRPDVPPLPCAREQLQQMLVNLILNAAEAMSNPGTIRLVSALAATRPEALVLNPAAAPRYALVSVEDHGCGIAPEILPRIFEPFFTTKAFSTRRGTGLGLSMVYEFAKDQGFGLQVKSCAGQGSTFTIWIPLPI